MRNDCKMMVLSPEDLIAKEAHYHATCYCSYTSVNYKDNDEARIQEDAEKDDQEAFEFVKQRLKPDIIFLTTISDLCAEKLKDNEADDEFEKKTDDSFNWIQLCRVNRHYVETLEIEDLIHKNVRLEKEFDAVIKYNEEVKVLLKSGEILQKDIATVQNEMSWPPQVSHLTIESFKTPDYKSVFFFKLGKK